jgi:hypothetical protein
VPRHTNRTCKCAHEEFDHGPDGCRICGSAGCPKFRPRGRGKSAGLTHEQRRRFAVQQLHADIAAAIERFMKNTLGEGAPSLPMLKPKRPSKKQSYSSVGEIEALLPTLTKGATKTNGEIKLGKGERAVLIVIAQRGVATPRRVIRQVTGYTTRTVNQYLANLRGAGMVVEHNSAFFVTEDGRRWLGDFPKLPTGDALFEHWLRELPSGEADILEFLRRAYPEVVEKPRIDAALGFTLRTRNQYLLNLRNRLLVVETDGGVQLAKELVGGG